MRRDGGVGRYSWLRTFFMVVMAGVAVPSLISIESTGDDGDAQIPDQTGFNLVSSRNHGPEYYGIGIVGNVSHSNQLKS